MLEGGWTIVNGIVAKGDVLVNVGGMAETIGGSAGGNIMVDNGMTEIENMHAVNGVLVSNGGKSKSRNGIALGGTKMDVVLVLDAATDWAGVLP